MAIWIITFSYLIYISYCKPVYNQCLSFYLYFYATLSEKHLYINKFTLMHISHSLKMKIVFVVGNRHFRICVYLHNRLICKRTIPGLAYYCPFFMHPLRHQYPSVFILSSASRNNAASKILQSARKSVLRFNHKITKALENAVKRQIQGLLFLYLLLY